MYKAVECSTRYRVWIDGQEFPIGAETHDTIHGLVQAYGMDSITFVEDMEMKPFLDKILELMRHDGLGYTMTEGSYYYKGSLYYMGVMPIGELDMRRVMQLHYTDQDNYTEDKEYIERRHREWKFIHS